jgi:hypothetical protein
MNSGWAIALIVLGAIYIVKPDIFTRSPWGSTVEQRVLSNKNYSRYMRVLGGILIVLGTVFLLKRK